MSKNRGPQRKAELREVSETNAKERAKRTSQQQLEHLDSILGKDVGAVKERKKLRELIETPPSPPQKKKKKK
jgi:hypothetical protein